MPLALYSGTFDPVTKGHQDIVERAAKLFEKVVVGIFDTPSKTLLFSTEERVDLFCRAVPHLSNVQVLPYRGLTVDFAREIGAAAMVRGVRSITDVDYEAAMVMMNRKLQPQVDTVFLYTSLEYQFVSSTLIKEVVRYGGDITSLVAEHVAAALKEKYRTA
ncbi:MAG: pantetheine-phosphate adenylyltransferase [Chloroflexi bacterium]|nr:pantetheine-phosphate adenylyltransferase [Chloroflexota bacterium]